MYVYNSITNHLYPLQQFPPPPPPPPPPPIASESNFHHVYIPLRTKSLSDAMGGGGGGGGGHDSRGYRWLVMELYTYIYMRILNMKY